MTAMGDLPIGATRDLFAPGGAERAALAPDAPVGAAWGAVAGAGMSWFERHGIAVRDAVVIVPYAQLIAPAREAFAARSRWLPRIETVRTLAASLGPEVQAEPGAPTRATPLDRLLARRLLLEQPWGARWARRDGRGFEQAIGRFVGTVHEVLRATAAIAPGERDRAWARLHDAVKPGGGGRERDLAAIAVRWAALAPPPRTDALHAHAPAAWLVIEAGGRDALAEAVVAASTAPALVLTLDLPAGAPIAVPAGLPAPSLVPCAGFEDEAEAAAAQVLAHLAHGERPVALVAEDRLVVRRATERLARAGVRIVDETGWRLSTTRAAARFMTLLRAARHDAGSDALFDWLKSGTRWAASWPHAIAALEARVRRAGASRIAALAAFDAGDAAAARLRDEALAVLATLGDRGTAAVAAWLDRAGAALQACGGRALLANDAAGAAVLAALALDVDAAERARRLAAVADTPLGFGDFVRWCDGALEAATFRPEADGERADVHVMPLARAMLRPFAAAVLPGADATRLGAWTPAESLLPRAAADAIGIESPEGRQARERTAFAQLAQRIPLTLLRRTHDGAAALANSRYVDLLEVALAAEGRGLRAWADPRWSAEVPARPTRRAAAHAPGLLPARLSATAVEALRACPYRFFAGTMLRLREADELEGELDKRDFGNWLHDVLLRFHQGRDADADDAAGLHAAARAVVVERGLDETDFLPWQATFDAFVPRYVAFMRERDARGVRWVGGEVERVLPLPAAGIELAGRIDRIDEVVDGDGVVLELIDYKAGSQSRWRERAKYRFEDTQLAVYAALVRAGTGQRVRASYLALEGRPTLVPAEHEKVEESADALVAGLVEDVRRLRAGMPLPALGAGSTCDHCDARGLCRRDDWWPEDEPAGSTGGPA